MTAKKSSHKGGFGAFHHRAWISHSTSKSTSNPNSNANANSVDLLTLAANQLFVHSHDDKELNQSYVNTRHRIRDIATNNDDFEAYTKIIDDASRPGVNDHICAFVKQHYQRAVEDVQQSSHPDDTPALVFVEACHKAYGMLLDKQQATTVYADWLSGMHIYSMKTLNFTVDVLFEEENGFKMPEAILKTWQATALLIFILTMSPLSKFDFETLKCTRKVIVALNRLEKRLANAAKNAHAPVAGGAGRRTRPRTIRVRPRKS